MMKGTGCCSYALLLKWASDLAGQGGALGGWLDGWLVGWQIRKQTCTSSHLDFGGMSLGDSVHMH